MAPPIFPAEKRSFLMFLGVVFVICCLFLMNGKAEALSLCGVLIGFFGFFRLTFLLEEKGQEVSILTLPARLIFGLSASENQYKKTVWQCLQNKEVLIWFLIGFLYVSWLIYCSFTLSFSLSSEEPIFFVKNIPDGSIFSYLNIYEVVRGVLSASILGLVIFLSITYGVSVFFFKKTFFILFLLFIIAFGFIILKSDLIFSLPPFYTSLFQGVGFGKADLIFNNQPDIFIYPPTEIFKRYLEAGLIGIILFYAAQSVALYSFIHYFVTDNAPKLWAGCGLFCLFLIFIVDSFIIAPVALEPFKVLGFTLLGLCWGASISHHKT